MGRFASHLKLVSLQTQPSSLTSLGYSFVDYDRLTTLANESSDRGNNADAFREAWNEELTRASADFDEHYTSGNRLFIDALFDCGSDEDGYDYSLDYSPGNDARESMAILLQHKGRDYLLNIFQNFKVLLQVASLNSEALYLALRKYDERRRDDGVSNSKSSSVLRELLPTLYASTTYHATGARSLSGELRAVRELLEEEEAGDEESASDGYDKLRPSNGERTSSDMVELTREDEVKWFRENVKGLGEKGLSSLVAHRGFHCENDDSVARPIENSLQSFEYAWAAGVNLIECDVGATKDEKIIMAHDEDFGRLALMADMEESTTVVKDLTLADIMRMPLKHGSRPPLLVDVLRSAMAIGEHAKLVIEIKPGNSEIVDPLMMLFQRHPALLSRVAVIMSFDTYVMQDIADRFALQNMNGLNGGFRGTVLGGIGEEKCTTPGPTTPGSGKRMSRRSARPRRSMLAGTRAMQSVSYGLGVGVEGKPSVPKLLVLTIYQDYKDGKHYFITSVKDGFDGLSDKLPVGNGIDGVYIEYETEMIEPEGRENMLKLAESYTVGVWMLKPRDPDALSIAKRLVEECGVSYVNTDFHRDFFSS